MTKTETANLYRGVLAQHRHHKTIVSDSGAYITYCSCGWKSDEFTDLNARYRTVYERHVADELTSALWERT